MVGWWEKKGFNKNRYISFIKNTNRPTTASSGPPRLNQGGEPSYFNSLIKDITVKLSYFTINEIRYIEVL